MLHQLGLYAINGGLIQKYVTRSTYKISQQRHQRGVLDAQKQAQSRAQNRAQKIFQKAPQTSGFQGGEEITHPNPLLLQERESKQKLAQRGCFC